MVKFNDYRRGGLAKYILRGNVDFDPQEELVFISSRIYVFDTETFEFTEIDITSYSYHALYDWNNDGKDEIIVTRYQAIHVIDAVTQEQIASFSFPNESFFGIHVADFNSDGLPEIVVSSNEDLLFIHMDGQYIRSQNIGPLLGWFDAFDVKDFDSDGIPNIIVGSDYGVSEIDPACSQCVEFTFSVLNTDPTCEEDNGSIAVTSPFSIVSYYLEGIPFDSVLTDIAAGEYLITANSSLGCSGQQSIELVQQVLEPIVYTQDKSCFGPNDGTAFYDIVNGLPPFQIEWSTGSTTDSIFELSVGDYYLSVTNANNCQSIDSFSIIQSFIETEFYSGPTCAGFQNGAAQIFVNQGQPPYSFYWNGVEGFSYIVHQPRICDFGNC